MSTSLIYGVNAFLGTTEELFVGGDFDTAGSHAIPALSVWDGMAWTGFSGAIGGLAAPPSVYDLLVKDGDQRVASHFVTLGTRTSCNLAHGIDGTLVATELREFEVRTEAMGSTRRFFAKRRMGAPFPAADFRPAATVAGECTVMFSSPTPTAPMLTASPNPFNPTVAIHFALKKPKRVSLRVLSLDSRLVTTLAARNVPSGRYRENWNGLTSTGSAAASGTHVVKLESEDTAASRRAVLVR